MADQADELQFVATFMGQLQGEDLPLETGKIASHIEPEMLEDPKLSNAYRVLRERYFSIESGERVMDVPTLKRLREVMGGDDHPTGPYRTLVGTSGQTFGVSLRPYATRIWKNHKARAQVSLLEGALQQAREAIASKNGKAIKVADDVINRLAVLHRGAGFGEGPETAQDYVELELKRMDPANRVTGVRLPWPKLTHLVGDLIAGDAVGVPAYSNAGKTLFAANLCWHFGTIDQPAIYWPTESRDRFLSRIYSVGAGTPQKYAEREQWHLASEKEREDYRFAVHSFAQAPYKIVPRANVSPAQIIAQSTILRREFTKTHPGKPVVIVIDHMHRLDYSPAKVDEVIGDWTKRLRDWAVEDREGGIILMMLFQPRKPDLQANLYTPVSGYQIKGASAVMAELDILLSPYRRWVKVHAQDIRTPWGTPAAEYNSKGFPVFAKPESDGAKVDDENFYLKIGKRRTEGEGPTVNLRIDAPSGRIYEPTNQEVEHYGK